MRTVALDTETTGMDLYHGARPFIVTTCDQDNTILWWGPPRWRVDPTTRKVRMPADEVDEIRELIRDADELVLQNSKFDFTALREADPRIVDFWDWDKVRDTLLAGHLLASNQPHNLTDMTTHFLGVDIWKHEKALEQCVQAARRFARSHFPHWRIAKQGLQDMPSAKDKTWKSDLWLPGVIADVCEFPADHPWRSVAEIYANHDSGATILLWKAQLAKIRERGLWEIYETRLRLLPIISEMEDRGVTVNGPELSSIEQKYRQESSQARAVCQGIAEGYGYHLTLPKTGSNQSLRTFVFDVLGLPVVKTSPKTGAPSFDKFAIDEYLVTLPQDSKPLEFVRSLAGMRKRDTALTYMAGYRRFWLPLMLPGEDGRLRRVDNWWILHPNLNPTGTATLRWSSSNPNEQNIGKQEQPCPACKGKGCGECDWEGAVSFNIRRCFGPAPGREWWSMDAQNIELRIPAYEAGEEEMIRLFERPNDPPYFGSNHLLVSHILHPQLFEECVNDQGIVDGRIFKKRYASTWYQYVKNGNFAVQYGAIESSGTADRAYHVPGGQRKVQQRFTKIKGLNDRMIEHAKKYGYVETIPDRTVNPRRGYPLLCTRTEFGQILPTVPLNYHVQGTACWWMMKAMIRCQAKLTEWRGRGFDGFMAMQVHDELVFDFPRSAVHPKEELQYERQHGKLPLFRRSNLWRARELAKIMAQGGDDIGIPTPTSIEYHETTWAKGVSCG